MQAAFGITTSSTPTEDRRCWRCILLNHQCDRMPICQTCLSLGNDGLRTLPCKRGDIAKGLSASFANWIELQDEAAWLLQADDKLWRLTIDYTAMGTDEAYRHAILDLPWFPNPTSFDIHPVKEFLNQFDHLSDRWGGVYEALSETIIIKAAMHQYTQFDEDGHADDVYNIGDTHRSCARYNNYPILTALRCLVNIKSLAKFAHHFPMKWTVDEGFGYDEYELLSPDIKSGQPPGSRTLRPHIAVKVMPPNTELRDSAMSKGPEFQTVELLQLSIENTRRRLLTGNPRHWPEAFFAICILFLVHFDLELISGFTDTLLTAQHILRDSIESLCQLFLHCSGDLHPLHESRLDEEWLELVMGTDFEWDLWKDYIVLNEIWVANREDEDNTKSVRGFMRHLDNFALGWRRF